MRCLLANFSSLLTCSVLSANTTTSGWRLANQRSFAWMASVSGSVLTASLPSNRVSPRSNSGFKRRLGSLAGERVGDYASAAPLSGGRIPAGKELLQRAASLAEEPALAPRLFAPA